MSNELSPEQRNHQLVTSYGSFLKDSFGVSGIEGDLFLSGVTELFIDTLDNHGLVQHIIEAYGRGYSRRDDVRKSFDLMSDIYMPGRNVEVLQRMMSWMISSKLTDTPTLSLGSGPASAEIFLASQGLLTEEVVALDLSQSLLDSGRKVADEHGVKNIRFQQGDALEIDYTRQFGQVLMLDSLHWMDSWRNCINKAVKALKDDGRIFIIYAVGERARILVPEFELVKELITSGVDIEDLQRVDYEDAKRVQVVAQKNGVPSSLIAATGPLIA